VQLRILLFAGVSFSLGKLCYFYYLTLFFLDFNKKIKKTRGARSQKKKKKHGFSVLCSINVG
jgi:hypothetical protein